MPDATGLELIAHELRDRFPGSVADTDHHRGVATLVVEPESVIEVLRWLRDEPTQSYRFLSSLHACDYLPSEPRFGIHYELLSMDRVERLHVKALLADPGALELPEIDSCIDLFPTADFQEREVIRHVRGALPRSSRSPPNPDAGGLRGLSAAPRLPHGWGAGALHAQRVRAFHGGSSEPTKSM